MTDPRRKVSGRKPDPRKDKLAYFADNIQTHDEEDFDPKIYYYHRSEKEVNSSVLNDPSQSAPSRYSFASQSPPPGIFAGPTNIPSHPIQQPSVQSMGVRGPNLPNVPVQNAPPSVVSQPTGRVEQMMRYGNAPTAPSMPLSHSMQNMTSLAAASRTIPQMTNNGGMTRGTAVSNRMSAMSLQQQNLAVQQPQQQQQPQRHLTSVQTSQIPVRQMSPLIPNTGQMNLPSNYSSNEFLHLINRGQSISGGNPVVHTMPSSNYPSATHGLSGQEGKDNLAFDINDFPVLGLKNEQLGGVIHKPIPKQQSQSQKELRLSHDEFPTLPSVGYKATVGSDSIAGNGAPMSHPQDGSSDQLGSMPNMASSYPQTTANPFALSSNKSLLGQQQKQVHHQQQQQNFQHIVGQQNNQASGASVRIARPSSASSGSAFGAQYDQQYMAVQQPRHTQLQPQISQQPTQQKGSAMQDQWGLLGLLNVIRMTNPDLNTLALGTDLTTLGLNLNSPDCLYAAFSSPFADGPFRQDPDFHLPPCYYMQPPMQPPELKVTLFSEETLFYIFYSMPRDFLQIAAAIELNNRDWRYHKEHQLWFTRVPGTEPLVKTSTYERGSYIFFDSNTWDKTRKDNFMIYYDKIAEVPKLLPSATPTPVATPPSQILKALV